MINLAIVEDVESNMKQAVACVNRYAEEYKKPMQVSEFTNGNDFLTAFKGQYDLIFLDIEMPGIDGMDVARSIRRIDKNVLLVFITNIAQYAIQGYEVGAFDFILKPLKYPAFELKMTAMLRQIRQKEEQSILLNLDKTIRKVALSEIYFIEVMDHNLYYHLADEVLQQRGSLKAIEAKLTENHFVRCSSSFIVNLRYVIGIKDNYLLVQGNKIPISRSKKKEVFAKVADYIGGIA